VSDLIRAEREGPIARLVLDRPEKGHAWLTEMWVEAVRLVRDAASNDDVRVILLDSTGDDVFSGGADLVELASIVESSQAAADLLNRIEGFMAALEDAPQPVIAVISGAAIGAGLEIAAAADLRVASDRARFGVPAANMGIVITRTDVARLVRIAGPARAWDLLLTGRVLDAGEALAAGMVSFVAAADELRDRARAFATDVAALSPRSLREMKRHLLDVAPRAPWDRTAFGPSVEALTSDDFATRVAGRFTKRSVETDER
jgi:enoyl-CoA hydratase/carnithine racemase